VGEHHKPIGQILRQMELVSDRQIDEALAIQRRQGGVLGEILVDLGYTAREEVLLALAAQVGMEWVDLTQMPLEVVERTFRWLKGEDVRFDVPETLPESVDPLADSGPVAKLVDLFLSTAMDEGATEIRFELLTDRFQIRYRLDGVLTDVESPPRALAPPILERVRRLTGLSTSPEEERQERHVRAVFAGRRFHVEAISFRTSLDETVALRFSPGSFRTTE